MADNSYIALFSCWKHGEQKLETMYKVTPSATQKKLCNIILKDLNKFDLTWVDSGDAYDTIAASNNLSKLITTKKLSRTICGDELAKGGDYLFPLDIMFVPITCICEI